MIKKLNKISFTFSPKALLSGRPDRSLLRDNRVLFSLGSPPVRLIVFAHLLYSLLKRRTILTLEFYLQKLNCFTVFFVKPNTLYLLKNKTNYILNTFTLK